MDITRVPRGPIRPFVQLLWASDTTADRDRRYDRERLIPTGAMHLAIRLTDPPLRVFDADGGDAVVSHAVIGGARSVYYVRDVSVGARSVGAMLFPGAALPLLGMPASEFAERHVPLASIWGAGVAALRDRLIEAATPEAALDLFEAELARRLPRVRGIDPIVAHAVARFDAACPVGAVVDEVGYSHRHFAARFREAVGLAPKRYCRVRRVARVVERAAASDRPWAELAYAGGFSDQAHLTREVGELAGVTPADLRRLSPGKGMHVPIEDRGQLPSRPRRPRGPG
jgi:AraC-like DNA-binding protein